MTFHVRAPHFPMYDNVARVKLMSWARVQRLLIEREMFVMQEDGQPLMRRGTEDPADVNT